MVMVRRSAPASGAVNHPSDTAGQAADSPESAAEQALDETIEESFPASDPPSWTLGVLGPGAARSLPTPNPVDPERR
jgi:hypothetical protein